MILLRTKVFFIGLFLQFLANNKHSKPRVETPLNTPPDFSFDTFRTIKNDIRVASQLFMSAIHRYNV